MDVALGVRWLSTLGRILFNFYNGPIKFIYKEKKHMLRGASDKLKSTKVKEVFK